MVHSAAFNERRREQYRRGRLFGLTPREAGHLYNDTDAEAKINQYLLNPPSKVNVVDSPAERDRQRHLQEFMSAKRVDTYQSHNIYGAYAKVVIHTRDPDTGIRGKRYITVNRASSKVPTRGELVARVRDILAQNEGAYPEEVTGFTVDSVETVPDRTETRYPRIGGYQEQLPPPPPSGPIGDAAAAVGEAVVGAAEEVAQAIEDVVETATGGSAEGESESQEEPSEGESDETGREEGGDEE